MTNYSKGLRKNLQANNGHTSWLPTYGLYDEQETIRRNSNWILSNFIGKPALTIDEPDFSVSLDIIGVTGRYMVSHVLAQLFLRITVRHCSRAVQFQKKKIYLGYFL